MFDPSDITHLRTRDELRAWLQAHTEGELYVPVNRSKQPKEGIIPYVDAVEEALCFGWIDSTLRNVDGVLIQRFSPRRKHSHWTELNLQRCREMEQRGRMTPRGRAVLPQKEAMK